MKKLFLSLSITLILVFTQSVYLFADIPPSPNPPQLVNDLANLLTKKQESDLEYKLRKFHNKTSTQIVVLTVSSLGDLEPAMFAHEVGEKWGVGQKGFNNGIVILVKPKLSYLHQGETYIAVGYGLEALIPDAIAKRIIENNMIPEFQNGYYFQGILKATSSLMALASGEIFTTKQIKKKSKYTPLIIIFSLLSVLLIFLLFGIWSKGTYFSFGSKKSFWKDFLFFMWFYGTSGSTESGKRNSGNSGADIDYYSAGFSNFGGGNVGGYSGSGSGYGGGGFSGFGGGSFGGGGAGGSW